MKSVLFLIPTLDRGGAENVLVNLVNCLDQNKYHITVQTLFDRDSQKNQLHRGIEYKSFLYKQFHGNSRLQAIIPAQLLYRVIVKKRYDIIISYLEGPSTHVISGCPYKDTKKLAWVHVEMDTAKQLSVGFRSIGKAVDTYRKLDRIVFVANTVKRKFEKIADSVFHNSEVIYNTVNSDEIREKARESIEDVHFSKTEFNMISVGRIIHAKGFDRLARIQKQLNDDGFHCHTYILGKGSEETVIKQYIQENDLTDSFTFLGFKDNPYKYVARSDLFVCSSRREGFSTAVTEALILGVPVLSTNCSGAFELLGEHNEYGIVTENSEEALYQGIKALLENPERLDRYHLSASERGQQFDKAITVKAVEDMLDNVLGEDI